jgi:large subunit ribosomal protein L21
MSATATKTAKKTLKKAPPEAPVSTPTPVASSSEFAVIATGGKQYVVSSGMAVKIEKLSDDAKEGDTITFDKVLIVDNGSETTIGDPYIGGAKVTASLLKIGRNQKVETIKYKQKSRYFIRRGHRQHYFLVRIESIK